MKEYMPGKNAAWVLRIWLIIITLPAVFAGGAVLAFSFYVGTAMLSVLAAVFIAFSLFLIPLWLKNIRITVSGEYMKIEKGVIFKSTYIICKEQIIYISKVKTPLSALFGLCSVKINSARTKITIPLISKEAADTLTDFL